MSAVCVCGHGSERHESSGKSLARCWVPGCQCLEFFKAARSKLAWPAGPKRVTEREDPVVWFSVTSSADSVRLARAFGADGFRAKRKRERGR